MDAIFHEGGAAQKGFMEGVVLEEIGRTRAGLAAPETYPV